MVRERDWQSGVHGFESHWRRFEFFFQFPLPYLILPVSFGRDFTVLAMCIGNVQVNWPKLFQDFSVKFTLIFSCMRSFNHSTSAHVKIMHIYPIDAKLWLLEHFEKLVKLIIIQVIPQSRRNRPLTDLRCVLSFYRVQNALKVTSLHLCMIFFTCADVEW